MALQAFYEASMTRVQDVIAEAMDQPLLPLERLGPLLDPEWHLRRGSVHDRCMQAILARDDSTDLELLGILAAEDWRRGDKSV